MADEISDDLIVGLDHVQVAVAPADEAQAKAFYGGVLGLIEVPKPANLVGRGGAWYRCGPQSAQQLHLGLANDAQPQRKGHPALLTQNLAAVRARLEAAGRPIVTDEPIPGYDRFYSSDPFGNRLEFLQPLAVTSVSDDAVSQRSADDAASAATKALNRAQFGATAQSYVDSPNHRDRDDLATMVAWAAPQPADYALDISTGGGHAALAMAPHVARIVVSDLTPQMLAAAQAHLRGKGVANADYVIADAEALPFLDAAFDIVTVRIAPHHYPHIQRATHEMARVLKSGGRLVVIDNIAPADATLDALGNDWEQRRDPSHVREYTLDEWLAFLAEAGLRVTRHETQRHTYEFTSWVERMRTPADVSARLEADILAAPPAARVYFDVVEADGRLVSWSSDYLIALAEKPQQP